MVASQTGKDAKPRIQESQKTNRVNAEAYHFQITDNQILKEAKEKTLYLQRSKFKN